MNTNANAAADEALGAPDPRPPATPRPEPRHDHAHPGRRAGVLGNATMPVANLMKLGRGAVVPLDHRIGEPVDVVVNGRLVARGEVVVLEEDNSRFGVSLTEIAGPPGGTRPTE